MLPDFCVFLRLAFRELAELLHHPVGHALADRGEHVALLDQLARDVERQVGAVDDQADEAQPARQNVGVLGDEHAPHIELVAALSRGIEQVERPRAGDEGEHGVFVPPLGAPVHGQRRLVELAGEAAVEFGVFLRLDLGLRLRPDRRAVGDAAGLGARLVDKVDRHRDRARMLAHDPLDPPGVGELVRGVVEMEDDARAALGRGLERQRRDGERPLAVGRPAPGLGSAGPPRLDHDLVGDHEGGIEADAELADQRLGLPARLLGGQLVEKSLGAGAGDGAEPSVSSSRVMPTPLSATVSVFFSGSSATVIANGPLSMSSGFAIAS